MDVEYAEPTYDKTLRGTVDKALERIINEALAGRLPDEGDSLTEIVKALEKRERDIAISLMGWASDHGDMVTFLASLGMTVPDF